MKKLIIMCGLLALASSVQANDQTKIDSSIFVGSADVKMLSQSEMQDTKAGGIPDLMVRERMLSGLENCKSKQTTCSVPAGLDLAIGNM